MDDEAILDVIAACETERKLLAIPAAILELAWRREAQVEAVVDAVLHSTFVDDQKSYAQARRVGEWCARLAVALPYGPDPSFARRVGVLREIAPSLLERLPETQPIAAVVRMCQKQSLSKDIDAPTIALIVAAAEEFETCITPNSDGFSISPKRAITIMKAGATASNASVIAALECAIAGAPITTGKGAIASPEAGARSDAQSRNA